MLKIEGRQGEGSAFFCKKTLTCRRKNGTMKNMENTKSGKQNIGQRLDAFFDKNYAFFFAPLIVSLLYMFALWQYGVYEYSYTDKVTAAAKEIYITIYGGIEQ